MEVFTGDRQIPNPDEFPQLIAPFPEPIDDLIFAHSTAVIHSPDIVIDHRPISPPHKLRPIRYNTRSPVTDFPGNEGLVGTLGNQVGPLDGEFVCAVKLEAGEAPKSNDVDNGGNVSVIVNDPVQVGSGTFGEDWEINGGGERVLENESRFFSVLSSDTDDGADYSAANFKGPINRKRRKSGMDLEHFLENLVRKVMEKQDQMHNQLIEMIEKLEKERILREEAWKQLEMERIKRDQVVRAQENSRSLALISFLQDLLGEEIQIPEPVAQPCWEENGVESADTQADTKCDPSNQRWPEAEVQALLALRTGVEITDARANMKCEPNNRRWPEAEVQALIALRTALEHKFRITGSKGCIWEEISVGMCSMGYNRTAKKCKEKWDNINKYFKKSAGSRKKRSANGKACPYFQNLDLIYKNGVANSGIGVSTMNNGDEGKNEKDSGSPYTG